MRSTSVYPDGEFNDAPFGVPPDVVLDVPVPPSVNLTRRFDKAGQHRLAAWHAAADARLMASGQFKAAQKAKPAGRFEVQIILCEQRCRLDADNPLKAAIDYLRRLELVANDDKRYMRKVTVQWGEAPAGCRIILRGAE